MGLLTSQIMWTEEVEDALEEQESGSDDALKKYSDLCSTRLFFFTYALLAVVYVSHVMRIDFSTLFVCNLSK
jgi:hypothetical protein